MLTYLIKVTRSSTKGSFLPVNVSIIINSFLEVCKVLATSLQLHILPEVNEIRQTLRVVLEMETTWFDPRLTFKHVQKEASLNVLWRENNIRLWRPAIIFANINPSDDQLDRNEMFKIVRNPAVPPTVVNSTHIFNGSDHKLLRRMEHTYDWRWGFTKSKEGYFSGVFSTFACTLLTRKVASWCSNIRNIIGISCN